MGNTEGPEGPSLVGQAKTHVRSALAHLWEAGQLRDATASGARQTSFRAVCHLILPPCPLPRMNGLASGSQDVMSRGRSPASASNILSRRMPPTLLFSESLAVLVRKAMPSIYFFRTRCFRSCQVGPRVPLSTQSALLRTSLLHLFSILSLPSVRWLRPRVLTPTVRHKQCPALKGRHPPSHWTGNHHAASQGDARR